jgi:pyridoxal phosphate enzyme (YggS family)
MTKEHFNIETFQAHFHAIQARIQKACLACHREPHQILLVAASKARTATEIEALYTLQQCHFGENYLQEALEKIQRLTHLAITWHFIGKIQSNKIAPIAQHFSWVHSVESLKQLQQLNRHRAQYHQSLPLISYSPAQALQVPLQALQNPLQVCLQVNLDQEPQKSGLLPEELPEVLLNSMHLTSIHLRGLMCIPKATLSQEETQQRFHQMKTLQKEMNLLLKEKGHQTQLDILSMGMSDDFEEAIIAGSHIVRIGSALFGRRN